ncbi:unnamed protein product [Urochloa humidicola]
MAGVWTLLSCTLCFLCAFNLGCKPLYAATFLSFVYALGYLAAECLVFDTMRAAGLATFIFVAGTSMVWMLLEWNFHSHARPFPVGLPNSPDRCSFLWASPVPINVIK